MKFADLKIGVRIALSLFVVLFFTALITVVGIRNLSDVANSTKLMEDAHVKVSLAQEWLRGISTNSVRTIAKARSNNIDDQKILQKEMELQSAEITKIQEEIEPLIKIEEGKKILKAIAEKRKEYVATRNEVFKLKEEKRDEGRIDINGVIESKLVPSMNAYVQSVKDLVEFQKKVFSNAEKHVIDVETTSKNTMLILGALAVILGSIYGALFVRNITKPLNYAVLVAKTISSGNLTQHIEMTSKDEVGQLLFALKEMNANLANIVGQVRQGTETITIASKEIAAGNLDLSSRTEQQAASLEETASSMEELTSTVKQNADNAQQANNLANSASEISIKGGEIVSKVVDTMKEINDSSKKVADIISVIDGIAFQTNILALNAAVEAARAGEAGRGFAVVASEVRNLAQRSSSAAKEIKNLIDDSVGKVGEGSRLVDSAGTTMAQVVDSIKQVTDIMSEITAASQEQASGIEQVNKAITQMDQVTQQNASLVEEASAASQAMQDEAIKLVQTVGIFKVEGVQNITNQVVSQEKIVNKVTPKTKKQIVVPKSVTSGKVKKSSIHSNVPNNEDWEEF